jgi:putative transposase
MPGPAGGAIDGQSVKTTQGGGAGGFDAGRRIEGRKRHALTAAPGRPVGPVVHRAGVPDRDGAPELPRSVRARWPWLRAPVAAGAWDRGKLVEKAAVPDFTVEAGRRIGEEPVFELLPGRRVVERAFAWPTRWRRLVREHEARIDVSEAMNNVAAGRILLRRARDPPLGRVRLEARSLTARLHDGLRAAVWPAPCIGTRQANAAMRTRPNSEADRRTTR